MLLPPAPRPPVASGKRARSEDEGGAEVDHYRDRGDDDIKRERDDDNGDTIERDIRRADKTISRLQDQVGAQEETIARALRTIDEIDAELLRSSELLDRAQPLRGEPSLSAAAAPHLAPWQPAVQAPARQATPAAAPPPPRPEAAASATQQPAARESEPASIAVQSARMLLDYARDSAEARASKEGRAPHELRVTSERLATELLDGFGALRSVAQPFRAIRVRMAEADAAAARALRTRHSAQPGLDLGGIYASVVCELFRRLGAEGSADADARALPPAEAGARLFGARAHASADSPRLPLRAPDPPALERLDLAGRAAAHALWSAVPIGLQLSPLLLLAGLGLGRARNATTAAGARQELLDRAHAELRNGGVEAAARVVGWWDLSLAAIWRSYLAELGGAEPHAALSERLRAHTLAEFTDDDGLGHEAAPPIETAAELRGAIVAGARARLARVLREHEQGLLAFGAGFASALDQMPDADALAAVRALSVDELATLVCGRAGLSGEQLWAQCAVAVPRDKDGQDPALRARCAWLRTAVEAEPRDGGLGERQRRRLLQFGTGLTALPADGLGDQKLTFRFGALSSDAGETRLPEASTCSREVRLPSHACYSSASALLDALCTSINESRPDEFYRR